MLHGTYYMMKVISQVSSHITSYINYIESWWHRRVGKPELYTCSYVSKKTYHTITKLAFHTLNFDFYRC